MSGDRGSGVRVAPITSADLPEVGAFLHAHLNRRLSARAWAAAAVPPWPGAAPNHGFLLRDGTEVVGVQLAFYADREVGGSTVRFCNLAAWCVLESHRGHGLGLLRAVLAQRGYHFTDLSPSGSVIAINERLRFRHLDTTTALVPHLPLPRGGARLVTDLAAIADRVDDSQRRILDDHRRAAAARHVLLDGPAGPCYVIYRRDRRKRLPVFATLLHVSRPDLLHRYRGVLRRHLLARGHLATLAELRVVGERPAGSVLLRHPRPKMFRSAELPAQAVDNLYSELALVAW